MLLTRKRNGCIVSLNRFYLSSSDESFFRIPKIRFVQKQTISLRKKQTNNNKRRVVQKILEVFQGCIK